MTLKDKRIILTRAADKNEALAARISQAGGAAIIFPVVASAPVADDRVIREAVASLDHYSYIVFTSAQAVEYFLHYVTELPVGEQLHYAAVGSATAAALEAAGATDVLVPEDFRAEGLVSLFEKLTALSQQEAQASGSDVGRGQTDCSLKTVHTDCFPGARTPLGAPQTSRLSEPLNRMPAVLIPRALKAREVLPEALERLGFEVTVAPLYETVLPEVSAEDLATVVAVGENGEPHLAGDAVVFTSPSTVKNFVTLIERAEGVESMESAAGADTAHAPVGGAALLATVDCYSIGVPTSEALRHIGVPEERIHQAATATTDSLFDALLNTAC